MVKSAQLYSVDIYDEWVAIYDEWVALAVYVCTILLSWCTGAFNWTIWDWYDWFVILRLSGMWFVHF